MNLLYTDVETDLRASVADLLGTHSTDLWPRLAAVGVSGLAVPEELGGQGASYRELAVVAEELGRSVAPVPFLTSAVLATTALLELSEDASARSLLSRLSSGAATAALVVPLSSWESWPDGRGLVRSVADAGSADVLLVPIEGRLHLVDAADVTPVVALDETRPLADVAITATTPLAGPGDDAVRAALVAGAGILASEQVGIATWCLETTVAYLKERHQFGRPLGSFQALKHRVADLWQSLVLARAAARHAADALTTGVDVPIAVSVAQSLCSTVAVRAAEECLQLHGGIGMTWEHPVHRYLKRAKANEIALGTPTRHRATLAPLVDLAGPTVGA
ncbi:alkylation response protein AidB-like acyl-CoA dehydrogenase [Actinokineospora baliensis]|uniref:acyl-CoA dehydrogenase family protein n=1 Tax=Actinokineospora baliensis TaxID=547056 RepID=UPI00195AFA1E|nr:acyl-CoA dehydrogenase family protein [Actinokineospora baliensis]MBM7775162.1 alkylation response protein AidB-like acyl-CoA dehydrogenase [Actinokineospora baliensis]